MNIGLTGGIATGKSTVAASLVRRGAFLIDADQIAREVVEPGSPVLERVFEEFGYELRQEDGTLNRAMLGDIIFGNEELRAKLGSILHPAIRKLMLGRMKEFEQAYPNQLVVVDVPLLYESNLVHYFEQVMLVYVPESIQLDRLMKRNQLTMEQATKRIQSQLPIEEKKNRADIVIDNSGTLAQTEKQLDQFWAMKGL